jgi:hypothetical protein
MRARCSNEENAFLDSVTKYLDWSREEENQNQINLNRRTDNQQWEIFLMRNCRNEIMGRGPGGSRLSHAPASGSCVGRDDDDGDEGMGAATDGTHVRCGKLANK